MKLYLAGPMTGIPKFNFPAFIRGAALLRKQGHEVISPAEMDLESGFNPDEDGDVQDPNQYAMFLARDIVRIAEEDVDGIVLLPGWESSGGAAVEVAFIRALKKGVFLYNELASGRAAAIPA